MKIVDQDDLEFLLDKDEIIREIYALYGAPPNWERTPDFISLSKIILEQQVSLASAKAHFERLNDYVKSFSPEHILQLSDEEMRNCHISWQKAKYLRNLSEAIVNGDLVLEELVGVGELSRPKIGLHKSVMYENRTKTIYATNHPEIFRRFSEACLRTLFKKRFQQRAN